MKIADAITKLKSQEITNSNWVICGMHIIAFDFPSNPKR